MPIEKMVQFLQNNSKNEQADEYQELAQSLFKEEGGLSITAYLLKDYFQKNKKSFAQVSNDKNKKQTKKSDDKSKAKKTVVDNDNIKENITKDSISLEQENNDSDDVNVALEADVNETNNDYKIEEEQDSQSLTYLYVSLGKDNGLETIISLAQRISDLADVEIGCFSGRGSVRDSSSHIELEEIYAQKVIDALHGAEIADETVNETEQNEEKVDKEAKKTITCELANSKVATKKYRAKKGGRRTRY